MFKWPVLGAVSACSAHLCSGVSSLCYQILRHLLALLGHELPEDLVWTFISFQKPNLETSPFFQPEHYQCFPRFATHQPPIPASTNIIDSLQLSCKFSHFISGLQRLGERPQLSLSRTALTSSLAVPFPSALPLHSPQRINLVLVSCRAALSTSLKPWEQKISNLPRTLLP